MVVDEAAAEAAAEGEAVWEEEDGGPRALALDLAGCALGAKYGEALVSAVQVVPLEGKLPPSSPGFMVSGRGSGVV